MRSLTRLHDSTTQKTPTVWDCLPAALKPGFGSQAVLEVRSPLAITIGRMGSDATSVCRDAGTQGGWGAGAERSGKGVPPHSQARSFCCTEGDCWVGNGKHSRGSEQVVPLQLLHLRYCLELHNDSKTGSW